jgi:hypothetical protein
LPLSYRTGLSCGNIFVFGFNFSGSYRGIFNRLVTCSSKKKKAELLIILKDPGRPRRWFDV